uniref:Uncharacterized protein n=1 Tax=Eutreptiella gymnastica TaxID=73025 RepID=A0A7S1NMJ0_9EUGL
MRGAGAPPKLSLECLQTLSPNTRKKGHWICFRRPTMACRTPTLCTIHFFLSSVCWFLFLFFLAMLDTVAQFYITVKPWVLMIGYGLCAAVNPCFSKARVL